MDVIPFQFFMFHIKDSVADADVERVVYKIHTLNLYTVHTVTKYNQFRLRHFCRFGLGP